MISSYKNSSKPYLSSLNIRPVVKRRPEEAFMPALAGLVGGSLSTLLLHPLDVLKTRQGVYGGSMMYHLNKLWTTRGGLYRGVGANLLVSSTSWGLYFSSYEMAKKVLGNQNSLDEIILAAFGAGSICTLITNPISVVRSRILLTDRDKRNNKYLSISSTLKQIIKNEGFQGLYKGFAPNLLNVSHGTIQFVLYDVLKKSWGKDKLEPYECLASCVLSKLLATLVTYPCQNLRVRQQAGELAFNAPIKFGHVLKNEGFFGLYRGLVPTLIHVTPNICVVFLVYEFFVG